MSERMQGKQYGLGYQHTKEAKEKMKGRKHTEEAKKKISKSLIGNQHLTGKKLPSHSEWMKENNPSKRPEVKIKLSEAGKGRKSSDETKKKLSDFMKEKNPMKCEEVRIKHHISILKYHISKLETEII